MKTIKTKKGKILRVDDVSAESEVRYGGAKYVAKSVWKDNVRDVKKS